MILIDFTKISLKEKELVRKWRNDLRIRKWMIHQKEISKEKHEEFIESLKNDKNNKYWLVKTNEAKECSGVIYLRKIDKKKKTAELGLYVNPDLIGKGIGKILLDELKKISKSKYYLKKLTLEVLKNNSRAIGLYERSGFVKNSSDIQVDINGEKQDAIQMHLDLV